MQRYFRTILTALLLTSAVARVQAFSLLGPWATWQTVTLGYQWAGDIGGPMNINEGYRWPIPVITYAYDATFLKYYGTDGVNAVEAAIKIYNDLPSADSMSADLSEFPLEQYRYHPTAGALGIIDLKTYILGRILEQFYAAASAERFTFTLRSQIVSPAGDPRQFFSVVTRNFDPITWNTSPYVNNVLYTYTIFKENDTPTWQAVVSGVDSLAPELTSLSGFAGFNGSDFGIRGFLKARLPGGYFGGLTRDDAGQIRFNLRSTALNVETLFADVVGGTQTSVGSGDSTSSPWSLVTSITNTTGTSFLTNGFPVVQTALRPGVGKYKFVRLNFDSLIGSTLNPYAINWQDRYVSNKVSKTQTVSRLVTQPDLLISSGDYGVVSPSGAPVTSIHTDTTGWINESANNTSGAGGEHDGPGTTAGFHELGLSNFIRYYLNFAPVGTGVGQQDATEGVTWGHFDGTTNAPIVFPLGSSVREIENLALGGK